MNPHTKQGLTSLKSASGAYPRYGVGVNYYIITYGCQMNKSDSERIASVLENANYKLASKINEADLIVVNMCSVRQSAVNRVYGFIPKLKKLKTKNSKIKTILTGCVLKKDLKKFRNSFDYVFSIKALNYWKGFLERSKYFYYPDPRNPEFCKKFNTGYLKTKPNYSNNFSAFIPISIGCNNFCTYCVVPYTKGPLIHRNHKKILEETKKAIKKGFKEIWLLGQNVNSYQSPTNSSVNFPKLLKMVNKIEGIFWIRFTSSHPKPSTRAKLGAGPVPHRNEVSGAGDFSEELIEVIANSEKVTKYLNLPVQSGDNEILKKMNRPYTIEQYKKLVRKIRKRTPDISLSTDVIVGFPGETKKQFQNTVKLFKEINFDMAYIAQYSLRLGTAAAQMKDTVSPQEKERREKVLTEVLKETALENNKRYIGKTVEVLVDKAKNGFLIGKSRHYKTVKFKAPHQSGAGLVGKFTKAKIIDALPWGLKGE